MSCKLPKQLGRLLACLLLTCVVTVGQIATAQDNGRRQPAGDTYVPGTFSRPYYGGGGYGGGGGGYGGFGYGGWGGFGGGTVAGNYYSGLGRAIRAQGQYNLDTSAATINLQEARTRQIENRKLWTNTYFEMRDTNKAWRDAQRQPVQSPDTWVRMARETAPDQLSTTQLDPVTGRIEWPPGLAGPTFEDEREKLDGLFADRAIAHGAIGVEVHAEIRQAIDEMLDKLKARIRDYHTDQYLASRKFLTSLRHEATMPTAGYTETAAREPVPPPVPSN